MNGLFTLLQNVRQPYKEKLQAQTYRGLTGEVWRLINLQAEKGKFDKEAILCSLDLTTIHFDKISSALLSNAYSTLFKGDYLALLSFLSKDVVFAKLFFQELKRIIKQPIKKLTQQQQIIFYKQCFEVMHTNMPILYHDIAVSEQLAQRYVALFADKELEQAKFYMGYKLLLEKIETSFANASIKKQAETFHDEIKRLGVPADWYAEDEKFDYYWVNILFLHATENFEEGLRITELAEQALKQYEGDKTNSRLLIIRLKQSEFLYYLSRFDIAFQNYQQAMLSPLFNDMPDKNYHLTKYIQVCLITDHLHEAKAIVSTRINNMGTKLEQNITPRDTILFAKYFLFAKDYEQAFYFIQLGFEKNPKGKYLQYEIELRHLQTACFALTNKIDIAVDMCNRYIKYLRKLGYGVNNSEFPHFYVLIKAIFETKTGKKLNAKQQHMLQSHQIGSFAVYGKLLFMLSEK